jgi:hypothetical protein
MQIDDNVVGLLDGMQGICYVTDLDYAIIALGQRHWNSFARSNCGDHLLDGAGVVGRSLMSFISGDGVRQTWHRAFDAVRSGKRRHVQVMTRCDSPGVRRELVVTVTPVYAAGRIAQILIQSLAVTEQARPRMGLYDFMALNARAAATSALPILGMCSYCQRVRHPAGSADGEGVWMTAEDYYHRGGNASVRISHGICPACVDRAEEALAA